MTDLATTPDTGISQSTVLEPDAANRASGGGVPATLDPEAPEPVKESLRDSIAAAVKESAQEDARETDAKPDKDTDKTEGKAPEKDAKEPKAAETEKKPVERQPDGKFAAKAKEEAPEGEQPQANGQPNTQPNGRAKQVEDGFNNAPAKFLPDAKEVWANVPRAVRRDIETLTTEHEAEVSRYREAAERYEPIRQFDEIVRQNGRAGIHETLQEVAQLEDMMEKQPLTALNTILQRAGPRKADGQPYSLFEIATAITQMGHDGYMRAVTQQVSPQPSQESARVAELEQRLSQMQAQQVTLSVIEPFKAAHPRYTELEGDIAFFLQSGKVPTNLSAPERLAVAYDMAVRVNPASSSATEPTADPVPDARVVHDSSGEKSIKSAPGSVSPEIAPDDGGSIRDTVADELRRRRA
jgi:hypothetical protein